MKTKATFVALAALLPSAFSGVAVGQWCSSGTIGDGYHCIHSSSFQHGAQTVLAAPGMQTVRVPYYSGGVQLEPWWQAETTYRIDPLPAGAVIAGWYGWGNSAPSDPGELLIPQPVTGTNPLWVDLSNPRTFVSGTGGDLWVVSIVMTWHASHYGAQIGFPDASAAAGITVTDYLRMEGVHLGLHQTLFTGALADGEVQATTPEPALGLYNTPLPRVDGLTNLLGTGGVAIESQPSSSVVRFENGLDETVVWSVDFAAGAAEEVFGEIGTASWTLRGTASFGTSDDRLTVTAAPLDVYVDGVFLMTFQPGVHASYGGVAWTGDWSGAVMGL